ncbi:hypothetical protein DMX02_12635 [Pseudomonas jessenii]|nr:hypothetical protein DMX02_12635 [Pseudomonas jessenii]
MPAEPDREFLIPTLECNPCRSEPARDSGVSVNNSLNDKTPSRAGEGLHWIVVLIRLGNWRAVPRGHPGRCR